jgi:uncharacterized protein
LHLESGDTIRLGLLFGAAVWAGVQNQLAGGGSFITLPALIMTGMDARAANITSTVALFPGQLTGGWMARRLVSGAGRLSFRSLVVISLIGGAVGSVLLLLTPSSFFEQLVPWLVLFATTAFAWGNFGRKPGAGSTHLAPWAAALFQFGIAIYGGYFGGGVGILMMAVMALSGVATRNAGATKNVLVGVMNATAVLVFLFSREVRWLAAAVACVGAVLGSAVGASMMRRTNEGMLRALVIVIGVSLTVAMFWRARHQAAPPQTSTITEAAGQSPLDALRLVAYTYNMSAEKELPVAGQCLCYALRQASRAVSRFYDDELRSIGLRTTQYSMLQILRRSGEVRQRDFAELTLHDETTLTRNLRPLVNAGWVTVRAGEDRREKWFKITTAGMAKLKEARPAWERAQARMQSMLPEATWHELLTVLPEIARLTAET